MSEKIFWVTNGKVQLDIVTFLVQKSRALVHANDMISHVTVLNRVKDFLPRMKEAEQQLEKELNEKSPYELDIEYVDDSAPYIEMVSMNIRLKADRQTTFI